MVYSLIVVLVAHVAVTDIHDGQLLPVNCRTSTWINEPENLQWLDRYRNYYKCSN